MGEDFIDMIAKSVVEYLEGSRDYMHVALSLGRLPFIDDFFISFGS